MQTRLINAGWLTAPAGIIRRGEPRGLRIRFPIPCYLVETAEHRILIDTGLHPDAVASPTGFYGQHPALELFEFEQDLSVADQIDLRTVTMVVLTHLHWDHAGGLALVPASVPLVIQRREWLAGHDSAAISENSYLPRDYDCSERPVVLVDGNHDLLGDGTFELLLTPGHTPGHQSVRLGDLVLGGDVAYFAQGLDDHRFPLYGHDHAEQARSAERLRGLRDEGMTVLPGHDPAILRPGPVSARRSDAGPRT